MTKPYIGNYESQEEYESAWEQYEEALIERAEEEKLERMFKED